MKKKASWIFWGAFVILLQVNCTKASARTDFMPDWPLRKGFDVYAFEYYRNPLRDKNGDLVLGKDGKEKKHTGIDIIGSDKNQNVYSIADDGVVSAYPVTTCFHENKSPHKKEGSCTAGNAGNFVTVKYTVGKKNYYVQYCHLAKGSITLKKGDPVTRETVIGRMGSSGNSTGAHLHLSICEDGYTEGKAYRTFDYYMDNPEVLKQIRVRKEMASRSQLYGEWLKANGTLSGNYYVFNLPPVQALTINITSYPTNITKGSSFGLRGSVRSNYNIASVKGYIIDSSGTVVQSTTDTPNAKSMDVQPAKLNQSLLFNKLSAGTYTLKVEAKDSSGASKTWSQSFTVKADTKTDSNNTQKKTLTATSTTDGEWVVGIPANYKLLCYTSSTATSSSTYVSAKTSSYRVRCTKKAVLSNGNTRYFFVSGDNKSVWFDFADGMSIIPDSITSDSTTPPDPTYIISFNANGGSVSTSSKTVTRGSTYGALPTPTRGGYTFDGWYTAQSGGSKITDSTKVNLTGNQTLYAHWSSNNTTPDSTLNINLTSYPTSITKGSIFSLRGEITSNYNITTVKGYIYSISTKQTVQSTTDTPNAKSMDVRPAKLNQSLLFDKLPEGLYHLKIEATDASGKTIDSTYSFVVSSVSGSSDQVIPNGTYVIATKLDTNYVLDISDASTANGANLQLWKKNGTSAQTFEVTHISGGYYMIVNTNSGKAISTENGSTAAGANVCQYPIEFDTTQFWKIESAGNGYYYIIGRGSLMYLDVDNANADSGTNVGIFYRNDAYDAQRWIFYKQ